MGLAASQAKLLSITSRLSDNELRSQSITAAKMALANQTTQASRKYLNALDTNEFIYRTYDSAGNNIYTALTGAQLSTYAPLKNQYALVNPQGQVLVSELDAANYESSTDINEFLAKYGVESIDTGETKTIANPDYAPAYEIWLEDYNEWLSQKPDPKLERYWETVPVTDSELYIKFIDASSRCYSTAMGGSSGSGCYLHVLAHLIDLEINQDGVPQNYPKNEETTVPGLGISIVSWDIEGSAIYHYFQSPHPDTIAMKEVSDGVCNGYKGQILTATEPTKRINDNGTVAYDLSMYDLTDADKNGDMSDPEYIKKRLLSNYTINANGEIVLKTLKQKCIDMFYLIDDEKYKTMGLDYDTTMKDLIKSFESDMQYAFSRDNFKTDLYDEDLEKWLVREPPSLEVPETLDEKIYKYSDKDKAQWYVNLWHRMNGDSDEKDGKQTTSSSTTTIDQTTNTTTITTTTNTVTRRRWDILEDGLMNSQEWLKYALESGTVSLERVNFSDPTAEGSGLKNATWTSIIYSNALDISEQTNETAIAKAEAEYEQKTREIENKDKQYDSILKLLDTEHSALQAELESAQKVIKSNTDRTLKIYS